MLLYHFRGLTFRKAFARIGEVRSIIPQRVYVMALTATATKATRRCIIQKLGMANTKVINISPEKSNIYLCVSEKPSVEEFVGKIVAIITRKGQSASKLLIFCRTYDACHRLL